MTQFRGSQTRVLKLTVFRLSCTNMFYVKRESVLNENPYSHALCIQFKITMDKLKVSFYDLIKILCIEDRRYWSNVCESF